MNAGRRPILLLIAGLQKSGTTLLLRLLVDHTSIASSPFSGVEGHDFWGNVPSHEPKGFPVGTIYASHGGELGHEISATAADSSVQRVMNERLAGLTVDKPLIVNKNPYHTVRLPWLKSVFPDCFIVCTVRQAAPNIYSLLKKHVRDDERDRPWRAGRWYGVKPRQWRAMLHEDALVQCTSQWCAVMSKLWEDREHVDLFVSYRQLCTDPAGVLGRIVQAASGEKSTPMKDIPVLRCCDDEFQRGAGLRSRNEFECLEHLIPGPIELAPFSPDQIAQIRARCSGIEDCFEVLRSPECQ